MIDGVRRGREFERSDTDIAQAAVHAMRWHTQVPSDRATAAVNDGWVTLRGVVDWQYQKDAGESAVRTLAGVRGITTTSASGRVCSHRTSRRGLKRRSNAAQRSMLGA
jgi:osmotically-inducible protein OsmY